MITVEREAIYVMDRGYLDFERLYRFHQSHAFFITRAKKNTSYRRIYSRQIDKTTGLRCDQTIALTGYYSKKDYPEYLRRIKFFDQQTGNTYVFLTNNFELDAMLITQLYKERWKIELFFKWIKQHLRIKSFYGTSYNAVCCQIWIAVCSYLLVAIVKKRLKLEHSLYTLLQIFSLTLFEKIPINELFTNDDYKIETPTECKQLKLFDL
jgi:IS4 transposase